MECTHSGSFPFANSFYCVYQPPVREAPHKMLLAPTGLLPLAVRHVGLGALALTQVSS